MLKVGKKKFEDFVKEGKIEYLDVNESDNCLFALNINDVNI